MFQDIEENKERLGITDYSVSQITLEQVDMDTCALFSVCASENVKQPQIQLWVDDSPCC